MSTLSPDDRRRALFRFIVFSLFGVFMFFVPITIGDTSSIPLDHLVTGIQTIPYFKAAYGLLIVIAGVIFPFVTGTWNKTKIKTAFSLINILGIPFVIMAVFNIGPAALLEPDMIPFVFNKVVAPVTTIIPIGSVFLAFIISYGLMEFVGVFMRPIMMPIFKTPGRSAIDAVASFVGSYSLALLITNGVYKEGMYTKKEACIIATGFSTVSATFMIIVAKTLGYMDTHWLQFFWITVIVTFLVTAITARLYPLNKKPDTYYDGVKGDVEQDIKHDKFKVALDMALNVAHTAPTVAENVAKNLKDGIRLALNMAPSLMAIGTLGLIIAEYTPVFDVVGYIFYPFTALAQLPDALLAAKSLSMSIAEMFLPAMPMAESAMVTRFVVGVTCISEILFFSGSIPSILGTEIPLKMRDYFIIWFERVVLSILLAAPFAHFLF
ncbi:YjiH family protein [Peptoniphilus equinus]|uniref:YjiH family protein n=1 Tax=Peptoniphilus equinus TaxID=3016343 RepID=A0ABY7QU21_9FIRM|nr:YjiH family protein [Peptoniphilus equinus]WBW50284.1 YjiH family protein [Peptoniphilus equinus]